MGKEDIKNRKVGILIRVSKVSPEIRKKRKEWEKKQRKKYGKDWQKKSMEEWTKRMKK